MAEESAACCGVNLAVGWFGELGFFVRVLCEASVTGVVCVDSGRAAKFCGLETRSFGAEAGVPQVRKIQRLCQIGLDRIG